MGTVAGSVVRIQINRRPGIVFVLNAKIELDVGAVNRNRTTVGSPESGPGDQHFVAAVLKINLIPPGSGQTVAGRGTQFDRFSIGGPNRYRHPADSFVGGVESVVIRVVVNRTEQIGPVGTRA